MPVAVTDADDLRARFEADRHAIEARFNGNEPTGAIREIGPGLSDPHDGGRTVRIVTLESGLRLVFKPRPVAMEAAFHDLISWCNAELGLPPLRAGGVLDRGSYGWMEWIEAAPCQDQAEVERYFERAGMLLALAWVLDATDLHFGNVIVCGEHPVLVDLETLLHPRWPGEERTVLDTGLVPTWIAGPDGGLYDVSGFGAIDVQRHAGELVPLEQNVVRLRGKVISPAEQARETIGGFRRMTSSLVARRQELLEPDHPLQAFDQLPVRVILRHTLTYRAARAAGSPPTGGLLRARPEPAVLAAIEDAERRALAQGDIPAFRASTGSTAWRISPGDIARDCFVEAPFTGMIDRLMALDLATCQQAEAVIRTALSLWRLRGLVDPAPDRPPA